VVGPIIVCPHVFNPKLLRSGNYFAGKIRDGLVAAESRVLDLGTGTGICAIAAAEAGARVVAVDINPAAVNCARLNVARRGLQESVDVRQSDLFDGVAGERFDLVLFNPPYYRGRPASVLDRAWRSTDVSDRFARELDRMLAPRGRALLLLSSHGDSDHFLRDLNHKGYVVSPLATRDLELERFVIFSVQSRGQ
jgi:release factor glutamine methyltransferase